MELILKNRFSRRLVKVLEVAVVFGLIVWVAKTYVATLISHRLTLKDLQTAAWLDPGNSEYSLRIGRMAQYNLPDINPVLAMDSLRQAAALNPRDPQPWLELAAAFGFQGKEAEAEACLRRADFLAPNIPSIQWVIGNFFLLRGDSNEAFRHFRFVLAGTRQYNQILFKTAWKATDNGQEILERLIPDRVTTEIDYLYFLLTEKRYAEAGGVWKRIAASRENFPASIAAAYMDELIGARLPAEAHHVWEDLRDKGLIKPNYQPTPQNLLVNGDFEEEVLNLGFDWRIVPVKGVYAGLDGSTYHSPSHSLLIRFSGNENVSYNHVLQYVSVEPGRSYRLTGFLKCEGITTDSGPRLQVRDAYDITLLNKLSEAVTGTSGGWTPVVLEFTTGPKTDLIIVNTARAPSTKLDNLIAGKVWLDDISLTPLPAEGNPTR
ncbi:MAG: hypothetical protein ACE145_16050 [Terriglobia bacterium]